MSPEGFFDIGIAAMIFAALVLRGAIVKLHDAEDLEARVRRQLDGLEQAREELVRDVSRNRRDEGTSPEPRLLN